MNDLAAGTNVVAVNGDWAQTGTDGLGAPGVQLWASESGALVATSSNDVFVRQPGGVFEPVRALGGSGATGVSGRGAIARVCGLSQDRVAELDLSRSPPVATFVPGLTVNGCRALTPLRGGGWAFGARAGGALPHVLFVDEGGAQRDLTIELGDAWVEALVETSQGLAVATSSGVVLTPSPPPARLTPPTLGFAPTLKAAALWQGRLFVGGSGGAILQRPAP